MSADVGAPFARRRAGARVRIDVLIYCVDTDRNLWGFTIRDPRQRPLVRSVAPSRHAPGTMFDHMCNDLNLLTGVEVQQRPNGRGMIRVDAQLDVAVRSLDQSGEIGFRGDAP